nr:MAG: hypothetical protein 1 [Marnaviridae sp.]
MINDLPSKRLADKKSVIAEYTSVNNCVNTPCTPYLEDVVVENKKSGEHFIAQIQSSGQFLPTLPQSDNVQYVISLTEDICILLHGLVRAATPNDFSVAILTFGKLRIKQSVLLTVMEQWKFIFSEFSGSTFQSDENPFTKLRNFVSKYDAIKNLPVFRKMYRFLSYCTAHSVFERLGVSFDTKKYLGVEKIMLERDFHSGPDFIHCMMDTTLFLLDTGYQCIVTGSLDPFTHSEGGYVEWIEKSEQLRIQAKYISNPEPHGFTVFEFLSNLDDAIAKGESIVRFNNQDPFAMKICSRVLNDMRAIRADCLTKRLAQQDRKAPFAVLVAGGSSVGKSTFTKMLYYHFGKLYNLPTQPEYRYVRNAFDQYWTNFNSSQWCIQLDDIAFLHPNKATSCDPSLMEMLQVINNVPYVPTQADLADKGKTPVRSRFVVATTNTESLNAKDYFACPLAVQRRLPYVIQLQPLPHLVKDERMLDTSKVPTSEDGNYPNLWRILVKRVVPTTKPNLHMGDTGDLKLIAIYDDVMEFLQWFNTVADESQLTQDKAEKCDVDMSTATLCACRLPSKQCTTCSVELQSLSDYVYDTEWVRGMFRHTDPQSPEMEPDDPWQFPGRKLARSLFEIGQMSWAIKAIVWFYFTLCWCIKYFPPLTIFISVLWLGLPTSLTLIWADFIWNPALRAEAVSYIGARAYARLRSPQIIVAIASLTTAIVFIKTSSMLFNMVRALSEDTPADVVNPQMQGISESIGVSPIPQGDKAENVWYKDDYQCTPFDVPVQSLSRVNWSQHETIKALEANCVAFAVRYIVGSEAHEHFTRGVAVCGQVYMCNNHSIPVDEFSLEITNMSTTGGISSNVTVLITPSQIQRHASLDLMFIIIPNVPPKKDIRSFFAKETFNGRFDGFYLNRDKEGKIAINPMKNIYNCGTLTLSNSVSVETEFWTGIPAEDTKNGDCGSLLISMSAFGPIIVGIHVMKATKPYAAIVPMKLLDSLGDHFSPHPPKLQVGEYTRELGPLNLKSPVRYIATGTANVYGSLMGFRGKKKSRVQQTLIANSVIKRGYSITCGKPVMNSYIPWRTALLGMTKPVTTMRMDVLDACVASFKRDIMSGLSPEQISEIKVYDNMTAVNGCPGLAYVDKVNRCTSAGFPFNKSKRFFLSPMEPTGDYQHPVVVSPLIEEEMSAIIKQYSKSVLYAPVFAGSLKDEALPFRKCVSGKTRVFCGAPMPWTLVVRKYTLALIRLIQKNRTLFESGPGTIAQSKEWDRLYKHITQFGIKRIVDGDYELFDKRMPAPLILAAFEILIHLARAAGWEESDIRILQGIAHDVAFPTVDMNGDFMQFFGSNPSGHPLTVIINGLANALYMRYCYFHNSPDRECDTFKQNVALMTYGDDVIMGINEDCFWMSHTLIKDTLSTIGINFTMADKLAESVPYSNMNQATFLKRSWRYEPELDAYVCPIDHSSIEKMLTVCVRSKTISRELQAVAVVDTAIREYFWYGKEVFQEKREMLLQVIEENELAVYCEREFPTWESLVTEFRHYSGDT